MNKEEKINFIKTAINNLFKEDVKELKEEQALTDLDLDSLDVVELQIYYEDATGYEIDTEKPISTVKDFVDLMK